MRSFAVAALGVAAAVLASGAAGPAAAAAPAGDPVQGKAVFARCSICHQVTPGKTGLGPNLAGVVGRKAGSLPGYAYSPAMKSSGITWTAKELDAYLEAPAKKVPGNKMAFPGLPAATDRQNVIAYLAAQPAK